jgi:hypothetical protein
MLGVILLLFDSPTLVTVIVLAVITVCVILLLIIELLRASAHRAPSERRCRRALDSRPGHDRCPRARGEGLRKAEPLR